MKEIPVIVRRLRSVIRSGVAFFLVVVIKDFSGVEELQMTSELHHGAVSVVFL